MTSQIEPNKEWEQAAGKFELPTPEHLNPEIQAQLFKGASASTWDAHDDQASDQDQPAFPMVVWLRGDEPWFSQFNLDAEATMQTLGIKRSRLTQISGKDLRVGRVRIDRYIKPVYRSIDVEQYLSWTRATASHQKSSDAIKIAVEQLQEQSQSIQTTLESITSHFTAQIKDDMAQFIETTVSRSIEPLCQNIARLESNLGQSISALQQTVGDALTQAAGHIKETTETIRQTAVQQAAALEVLTLQLNQTSEKASAMEERLNIWDKWLTANIKAISADLTELKKPLPFKKNAGGKKFKNPESASTPQKVRLGLRAAPMRRKPL